MGLEVNRMNQYTDQKLDNFYTLLPLITIENRNQLKKWGVQTHSSFEWLAYLTEEVGEVSKAISEYEYRNGTKEEIVKEAIQAATLALKIAEMYLDKNEVRDEGRE